MFMGEWASPPLSDQNLNGVPDECETQHFVRGDANADGVVDLSDPVAALAFFFFGETIPCHRAADLDDNGALELTDAISSLDYLFMGELRPEEPFPRCGVDLTPDQLSCEAFPPCP